MIHDELVDIPEFKNDIQINKNFSDEFLNLVEASIISTANPDVPLIGINVLNKFSYVPSLIESAPYIRRSAEMK